MHNSGIRLYIALCAHRPESSLLPSPCIWPPLPSSSFPYPLPSGNLHTVVCVYALICFVCEFVAFCFIARLWMNKFCQIKPKRVAFGLSPRFRLFLPDHKREIYWFSKFLFATHWTRDGKMSKARPAFMELPQSREKAATQQWFRVRTPKLLQKKEVHLASPLSSCVTLISSSAKRR